MRSILILLSVVLLQTTSNAQFIDDSPAIQAAIDLRNDFVNALEKKDFIPFAHRGMDGAIRMLADQIRNDQGDVEMSERLIRQWEDSSLRFGVLLSSKVQDLGDHEPLFPWINEYLGEMAAKYGTIIYTLPLVQDIQMINYALPVVFQPKGTWQTDSASQGIDLRVEYRKHFIPFANFVTYYVALIGCQIVADRQGQPEMKKVCKPAAEKLQFAMGRYIAPVVSDWIFNASNQSLQIGPNRLKYNTVEDLRRAIRN
ncbi:MAG: hypothetical protein KGP28_12290 [Bdellovibrionales bacterium]|nr:hypothetical protein [Bdellovibrionales bacterium]